MDSPRNTSTSRATNKLNVRHNPLEYTSRNTLTDRSSNRATNFDRNNEEWRRLRSPMNNKLNRPDSLDLYIPAQERAAADFTSRLYNFKNSPENMQTEFFRFAAESEFVFFNFFT